MYHSYFQEMSVIYTLEQKPSSYKSIFLAGPTYRVQKGDFTSNHSWRNDAIDIFKKLGYRGSLFIPEWRDNIKPKGWSYSNQVEWEVENLHKSDIVLFWIPRDIEKLPAFTTNVEFGEFLHDPKSIAGSPNDAVKNEYLKQRFIMKGKPWFNSLEDLCTHAIKMIELFNSK